MTHRGLRSWLVAVVYSGPVAAMAAEIPCANLTAPMFQLACFERQSFQTGFRQDCLARYYDMDRLACYTQTTPPPTQIASIDPAPPAAEKHSLPLRLEVGGDYAQGRYDGTLKLAGGTTRMQSTLGGAGNLVHYDLWWDKVGPDWLSLGLDHVSLRNQARITSSIPKFLTSGAEAGRIDLKVGAEITHINVGFRSQDGTLRPYGTIGIGGGRGWDRGSYDLEGFFFYPSTQFSNSSWLGDVQSTFGFDWAPLSWLTVGPETRLLFFTARPFGTNQQYIDVALGINLAARF